MSVVGNEGRPAVSGLRSFGFVTNGAGHFFVDMCQGGLPLVIPFLLTRLDLSYSLAGLIITVAYITSSMTQPLFGVLRSAVWRRMALLAGVPLACGGLILAAHAPWYWLLLAMVVMASAGTAMYHPSGTERVHMVLEEREVTRGMSAFVLCGTFGFTTGSMIFSPLLAAFGVHATLLLLLPLVAMPLLLWRSLRQGHAASHAQVKPRPPAGIVLRKMWLPVLVMALRQWSVAGFLVLIPLYFTLERGRSELIGGWMIFAYQLGINVGTFLCGALAERLGFKPMTVGGLVLAVPLLAAFPYVGDWAAAGMLFGAGVLFAFPMLGIVMIGQTVMDGNKALSASLTMGLGVGLGGIASGTLGVVADHFSMHTALLCAALLPLVAAFVGLALPKAGKKPADESAAAEPVAQAGSESGN